MPESLPNGIGPIHYQVYSDASVNQVSGAVVEERPVCIFVNGQELATLLCTPTDLEDLAVGFLFSEGVIDGIDDIEVMSVSASLTCVDLWLGNRDLEPPTRRILTSGCGGGVTFDDTETMLARHEPLGPGVTVTPSQISRLMQELLRSAHLYNTARGIHTSALSAGESVGLVAQDVGRHNTIDRLAGRSLREGVSTEGAILLTSGRISSDMIAITNSNSMRVKALAGLAPPAC